MSILDARGALVRLCYSMMGTPDIEKARTECRAIMRALEPEVEKPPVFIRALALVQSDVVALNKNHRLCRCG